MMLLPEITYSLERCRAKLLEYGALSGKAEAEVISFQSTKLAWNIYRGMRALMPMKNVIRTERLVGLKTGIGVKVRSSVLRELGAKYQSATSVSTRKTYHLDRGGRNGKGKMMSEGITDPKTGKVLNFRAAAVARELSIRESGRGFMSLSTPRPAAEDANYEAAFRSMFSRYGFLMSTFTLDAEPGTAHKHAELKWVGSKPGSYNSPTDGLSKEQQQRVIVSALDDTANDIQVYCDRKLSALTKRLDLQ